MMMMMMKITSVCFLSAGRICFTSVYSLPLCTVQPLKTPQPDWTRDPTLDPPPSSD